MGFNSGFKGLIIFVLNILLYNELKITPPEGVPTLM